MEQPAMQLWELEMEEIRRELSQQEEHLEHLWVDIGGEG